MKFASRFLAAMAATVLAVSSAQAQITFNPATVPGQNPGGVGFFGVIDVRGNGAQNDQNNARTSLSGGGTRVTGTTPSINMRVNSASDGNFRGDTNTITGTQTSDVAMLFRAPILVQTSGIYTFNLNNDDGFTLAFDGGTRPFSNAYSTAALGAANPVGTPGGNYIATYNGNASGAFTWHDGTGTGNRGAQVFLSAGVHQLDMTYHQGGGGANIELSYAQGAKASFDNTFSLLAGGSPNRVIPSTGPVGFQVRTGLPTQNVAGVTSLFGTPSGTLVFNGTSSGVFYQDDVSGACCGAFTTGITTFPGLTNAANDDNFGTRTFGTFNMPVSGDVYFHLQSDDGFKFHIDNAKWSILGMSNDGTVTVGNAGQDLIADFGTGNTDTIALANMSAGPHNFELLHWDGGGGSSLQVWLNGDPGAPGAVLLGSVNGTGSFTRAGIVLSNALTDLPEPSTYAIGGLMLLVGGAYGWKKRRSVKK